ncbi:hypothetical protein PSCICO_44860 [Pseudomonas cichorii]|nr:hypothetical protein PSCICO_44860 [Pseudomonas cichorii]
MLRIDPLQSRFSLNDLLMEEAVYKITPMRQFVRLTLSAQISDVSHHNPPSIGIIYLCGGILLLAISILVVRYASYKYPSAKIPDPFSNVKGAVTEEKGEV